MDLYGGESFSDSSLFYTDEFPEPPINFSTVFPLDQTVQEHPEIQFIWNKTIDPDPLEIMHYQVIYVTNLEDWQDTLNYTYSEVVEGDTTITLTLEGNSRYYWGVLARDSDGFIVLSNDGWPNELIVGSLDIEDGNLPTKYSLYQNFPNPFNPITRINYDIPKAGYVDIKIYDIAGRKITSLVNQTKAMGSHFVYWDGKNDLGKNSPGGMYIYTIKVDNFINSKKLVLIK